MALRILRVGPGDAIATVGPVAMRVLDTATTELSDIDEAKAVMDGLFERWSTIGALVVVHHGAPVPDAEVRRYARNVFGSYGDRLVMAHVMLGLGFWASAARVAVKTITGLIGAPSPIEATLEAGARRLASELIGVDADELIAAHDHLLAQLHEHQR